MLKFILSLAVVLFLGRLSYAADAESFLSGIGQTIDIRGISEALGAPAWLTNNIELILLALAIIFTFSLLTSIYRGITTIYKILRAIVRFLWKIPGWIRKLVDKFKKHVKQESIEEAVEKEVKKKKRPLRGYLRRPKEDSK